MSWEIKSQSNSYGKFKAQYRRRSERGKCTASFFKNAKEVDSMKHAVTDTKINSYLRMEDKVQKKFGNEMSVAMLREEWFAKPSEMLST